jgi:uncharacterized protein YegJ (DUF2314 family)
MEGLLVGDVMIWVVVGVVTLALAGCFVFWWIRRRRRPRLISFVALLREPVSFDPAVLAKLAGKAWNADLGDGASEGADGFVAGMEVTNMVMHAGRMFVINSFPKPYTDDSEKVEESIADTRIRSLLSEHRAWFSCDAIGVDGLTSEEEVLDIYRRLGKLFAEFLDEKCLLVYLPDSGTAYPNNEDTEEALRSEDPVGALEKTLDPPIIQVVDDDPLMKEAVEKARQAWPQFVAAYEAQAGEKFSVKGAVTSAGNKEFIWISVTSLEGDRIYGELANRPGNLGSLELGSKVSVLAADLNDWCFLDPRGKMVGGFTIEAVNKAARWSRKGGVG